MTICNSCGAENADGAKFCVKCGSQMAVSPEPGSWRAEGTGGGSSSSSSSSELGNPPSGSSAGSGSAYAPPPPGPSAGAYTPPSSQPYDPYNQGQPNQMSYQPQPYQQPYSPQGAAEPMHPAIPALVSLLLPGIGLLFVPNKAGLGIGVFVGYIVLWIVLMVLAVITLGIGSCLFLLAPLVNVGAAIHSWDEAAKSSNGKFQPILFK